MTSIKIISQALLLIIISSTSVFAQTITIPDTLVGWDQSWVASLNGSQASYNNWSQGGVSSLSGTGSSVLSIIYRDGLFSYGFRKNLKYGQANIKGEGVQKTDDLISIQNRFNYLFDENGVMSVYGLVDFRTQFDKGYDYETGELISDFMAPAYLTEGVGIAYSSDKSFVAQAGLGLKQTFVMDDSLALDYGLSAGENSNFEGGFTTGLSYEKEIFKNIVFNSSLDTFTNFQLSLDKTDVFWSNGLVGKINNKVNANFQFELRYDDDYSKEVQLKQVLSAGISFNLY